MRFVVVVQPQEYGVVLTEELAWLHMLHMAITKDHVKESGMTIAGGNSCPGLHEIMGVRK